MATLSTHVNTRTNPLPFTLFEVGESKGLQKFPQPTSNDANIVIWKNQVLIPILISHKLMAFHDPYPAP